LIVLNQNERIGPWVTQRAGGQWTPGRGQAIGWESSGELKAGVLVEDWNGASCSMHVAGEGNWADPEYLEFIFRYVFNQLKCNCVFGVVSAKNEKALKLVRHLGFEEVIRLEEAHPDGDLVLLRMWKEDCKWVNQAHPHPRIT
jgi:hypothetical protein